VGTGKNRLIRSKKIDFLPRSAAEYHGLEKQFEAKADSRAYLAWTSCVSEFRVLLSSLG
jgi:hypothetical protein